MLFQTIGGLLIGLALSFNWLTQGRITGMSGHYWSVITFQKDLYIRLPLLCGIVISSCVLQLSTNQFFGEIQDLSGLGYMYPSVSGLLIGMGSRMCNGSITGHSIIGVSRLSIRSLIASTIVILSAMGSANLVFLFIELKQQQSYSQDLTSIIFLTISVILVIICLMVQKKQNILNLIFNFITGIILGAGIVTAQLADPNTLKDLFLFKSYTALITYAVALLVMAVSQFATNPIYGSFEVPTFHLLDYPLIIGSLLFGLGIGITGLSIGSGLALFAQFTWQINLMFLGSVSMGQRISCEILKRLPDKQELQQE